MADLEDSSKVLTPEEKAEKAARRKARREEEKKKAAALLALDDPECCLCHTALSDGEIVLVGGRSVHKRCANEAEKKAADVVAAEEAEKARLAELQARLKVVDDAAAVAAKCVIDTQAAVTEAQAAAKAIRGAVDEAKQNWADAAIAAETQALDAAGKAREAHAATVASAEKCAGTDVAEAATEAVARADASVQAAEALTKEAAQAAAEANENLQSTLASHRKSALRDADAIKAAELAATFAAAKLNNTGVGGSGVTSRRDTQGDEIPPPPPVREEDEEDDIPPPPPPPDQ